MILNQKIIVFLISLFLISSCASSMQGVTHLEDNLLQDISSGLPTNGLWRQNIVLYDKDNNGFFRIFAPSPRKATDEQRRPFIFSYNNSEMRWQESQLYKLTPSDQYNYGAIAVGDINKDGYNDIVLANHEKKVLTLINDGKGNFTIDYPVKENFKSRSVLLDDVNGDGWLDIVALSEFYNPNEKDLITGIIVGINEQAKIKTTFIDESKGIFGDSLAVGDVNGDGKKDIVIAPLTAIKDMKKAIWLNDGINGFKHLNKNIFTDKEIPFFVRTGDIDGDGRDEIVFKISPLGAFASPYLKVFKIINDNIVDISQGLEEVKEFGVFDLSDIDDDKKFELGILTKEAISIYKYTNERWVKGKDYKIKKLNDLNSVYDFKMSRQGDGSVIFVYNLASDDGKENGIKAYRLVKEK